MDSRRRGTLVVALALSLAGLPGALAPADAHAQDLTRGRRLFQLCATCHGAGGAGDRTYSAPAIAGLPSWYIEAQLVKFKEGFRGFRAEDATGLQMRPMARALVTDADVKAVAAYVAQLKPVRPPATLKGDPGRGQAAYATCLACHGPKAGGNQALNAPALNHQADWYLVSQINKFRQGLRGTHAKDTTGALMRPMAMSLVDEQAILDLVAYIRSLSD